MLVDLFSNFEHLSNRLAKGVWAASCCTTIDSLCLSILLT